VCRPGAASGQLLNIRPQLARTEGERWNTTQSEVKSVSIQKLEANRRNALNSTGPRTPEGKANVRLNAFKHGFLSKQIVISIKPSERTRKNSRPFSRAYSSTISRPTWGRSCRWKSSLSASGGSGGRCELGEIGRARVEKAEQNPIAVEDPW
jgi:hypothetical protein